MPAISTPDSHKKLLYQDYLKYLEDDSTATDRFWSEFKKTIYVNTNAFTSGQGYELYGKSIAPIVSSDEFLLPFSAPSDGYEHSGNEAIVQLAYGEALDSEKFKNYAQAEVERKKGYQALEMLWKPFEDSKSYLQSKNRPSFNVPDYFGKGNNSQSIGNFTYLP